MTSDRDRFRVKLDVSAGGLESQPHADARGVRPANTLRIALLGDFSGRRDSAKRSSRGAVRVDRDSVDDALAHFHPRLRWTPQTGGVAVDVDFTSLDDFHPDRLYERLAPFRIPSERAAPAIAGSLMEPTRSSPLVSPSSVLDAILGDAPAPPGGEAVASAPQPTGAHDRSLADFVRRAVSRHGMDARPAAGASSGAIDAAGEEMRALLRHRDFQDLESLWRGVSFLVRRLETDEHIQIYLIDLPLAELETELADDVTRGGLYRQLVDEAAGIPGGTPWSLLIGCFTFGERSADFAVLRRVSQVARAAGAAFLAAAHSLLAGSSSFGDNPDPDDWAEAEPEEWREVRRSPDAACIGLVLPRFLLRLPYGERTDACEVLRFEEVPGDRLADHESYLWGNGALMAGLLIGEAFGREAESVEPPRVVGSLPLHVIRRAGEVIAKPCTEVALTQRDAARLLDRGLMPLLWVKESDAAVLPRLQSIASPLSALSPLSSPPAE